MPSLKELQLLQSLPLELKVKKTQQRAKEFIEFYGSENVYLAFSGGKDSTVLNDILSKLYPDIEKVFVDTRLEYPEIRSFVKSFDNITLLRPKMRFDEVIKKYGYPLISKEVGETVFQARQSLKTNSKKYTYRLKRLNGELLQQNGEKSIYNLEKYKPLLYVDFEISNMCCNIMKKQPSHKFAKDNKMFAITAQMACESRLRTQQWVLNGCNAFDNKSPISNPMSFWTEQDVLKYIKQNDLKIASVYGDIVCTDDYGLKYNNSLIDDCCKYCTTGCKRTGCIFCGFGAHLDNGESRFQLLKKTHPRQYEYCLYGGGYDENGIWKPNKNGLGMKHCFDELNKIYGKNFIKY